jgi:hypothetical protein
MTDDGGVLGNLPNSRPGKRSAKRDAGAGRKRTAAVKKPASSDGVGVSPDMHGKRIHDPVPPPATEDPVGAVVRTATGVAMTGVRVAGAVGREFFKRLPRP